MKELLKKLWEAAIHKNFLENLCNYSNFRI